MERVYLLLRDNQQSGPFTIGELLQQQLRSSDMIWIEGKSIAWTYLSELELIPFTGTVEATDHTQSIKTSDEIEKKAEELRQRILSAPPKTYFQHRTTEIETYPSPYKFDDEIQLVDHRKERRGKKNAAFGELLLSCFVIGLFMLGIYKGKSFLGAKHKVQNSVATQLNSGDEHAARKNNTVTVVHLPVNDSVRQSDSLVAVQKTKQKPATVKKVPDSSVINLTQPITINNQEDKKQDISIQSPPPVSHENTVKKEDTPAKKEIVSSLPEVKNNAPEKEEKRGFLRGLFKKKKKDSKE